ncbi:NADPH-dependent 2,4-dienoyl-CoA reductase/sulfur reductase-like enzyme/nitrite reductase/ring-hydroxylating ferredoxin subunit [Sphingomonas jinjuensis]|uniref:NADPH-dependent 2,4-dienoyl-CoA reductase/sulfur reductase-like enzyme/nitrite reductase/ring-hydroxylating ferredoxin subunit n=1 Tax=Sphingomonas jinjuensis TaxID=535907 RepID=A0A840FDL0_9SPHN|nr:FAD-dependent oxidoreductase [Sphingomonas jinjuensis]MBB4154871.1 NADPH-dependent 2,4-dienoyl-CoA reductase/sulfur reductase-like enzyme/nitrite reductase/ring-hydroxylating ferredoxin subunit [Sphingomonas jinjuensis]
MTERDLAAGIDASEIGEDCVVAGEVDGEPVVLLRSGGKLCALAGLCTHAKAPLADGIVADGTLRCPWHHARFDVATGEAVDAPAFAPLQRFEVVEENGTVRVGEPVAAAEATAAPARDIGRVVIVGGGAAGHACAEMLARHGAGSAVTMLSDEAEAPYDRTACSKAYLAGEAERGDLPLPAPDGAEIRLGISVERIDREARLVHPAVGEAVPYDTLILATGAEPIVPEFEGADRDDVHVVRTLADADALIAAAQEGRRAIVIGSSYIGLEVAASLIARGMAVTIVSDAAIPLEKTAGAEVGAMIRRLHEEKGVTFLAERSVTAWDGTAATLDDGSRVEGDLLVAGTGVKPRVALAEAAGLTLADEDEGGGVSVDAMLRTSDPAIHAIGDIANAPDPRLGHPIRVEHWAVAQHMGQWLARHLLGLVDGGYDKVPFFWSGHYDVNLRYVGHVETPDDACVDGDIDARDFALHLKEDGREQALLTCNRDRAALEFERDLERGSAG